METYKIERAKIRIDGQDMIGTKPRDIISRHKHQVMGNLIFSSQKRINEAIENLEKVNIIDFRSKLKEANWCLDELMKQYLEFDYYHQVYD